MKRKRKSEDVHEVKRLKDANGESVKSKGEEEDEGPPPESDFKKYRISKVSRKTLKSRGITHLFPIQYKTFDPIYDKKDVIGQARTGTGKTLSFVLPLVERLLKTGSVDVSARGRSPCVLVMAPTRELANQVNTEFESLSQSLSVFCIYGGVPYWPQESALRKGIDILVGTPGRILDHAQRGNLYLGQLK
uniref:Helicase ATP-binding domain-containing protein n=1 Tax=Amphimedon queenslandica TaxID=400682 RepID=A0A1X7TXN0_AMPQE